MLDARRREVWNNLQPFASNHYYPDKAGAFTPEEIEGVDKWVDSLLGLQAEAVEKAVRKIEFSSRAKYKGSETYFNVSVSGTQSSYADICMMLESLHLRAGQKVIDLGSGYGRMGFVIGDKYPDVFFKGYEIVDARRAESSRVAQSWGWQNVSYETRDLGDVNFTPDVADVYFMYDPANNPTTEKILKDLRKVAEKRAIRIVAVDGTGRLSRMLPGRPWLKKQQTAAANYAKFPIVLYSAGA